MDDLVSICEGRCRKACNLRSAAGDSEETCHSGSSGGRARRYRKHGSPKPAAGDAGAMDTDPSPVRLWDSEGHSEGYRTAYEQPSESEETARPPTRANTAPEPSLEHDAKALERPARARTALVARHTEPPRDTIGDTPMAEESRAPGTARRAGSGGEHAACHCEHVSLLMGKYPKMGMDAIVHRLDSLDNAKDGLEEDVAGILDDQSAAERDMAELRAEQDRYRQNLELALEKQQRVVDSLPHLVEDMSGRLKRLEELQPLASGPELPAKPAAAELGERVKTLRSAMDKPMGGPAGAPYAPPRVDPGALPFVPMFSESTMLGEHTAPAGSMRDGHVTTDPRSLTVQMSHAAQDLPITTTAHAVYAEEEIQSQTMQGRTMGSADRHGRGHPGRNLWAKDPNTGIWTAGGASPSRIPNPMGSGPTGPHSMEERDVRGVYSHPPSGARGKEASQEAGGGEDHGGGGYPCGYHEVLQEEPGRAQPDVGTEERRVRGAIWRHHGAKFAAPQQRGVEARGAAEDAGHLRLHEPGRDPEVHHGGVEAQCEERGPRAGSTWSWTTRPPRRPPSSGDPGRYSQLRGEW